MKKSKIASALSCLALVGILSACGGGGSKSNINSSPRPQNSGNAVVRLINASPDSSSVDLLIRGKKVAEAIPYIQASEYSSIDSGSAQFTVRDTGTFNTIEDSSRSFSARKQYSIFVFGPLTERKAVVQEDDNSEPTNNRVRLRFVNSQFDTKGVDVYIVPPDFDINNEEPAYKNIGKEKIGEYLESDEGTFVVRVTNKDQKDIIAESEPINMSAGQIVTAIFGLDPAGSNSSTITFISDRE